jgi:formylglycine-generating enzyme required for sulfatase activity
MPPPFAWIDIPAGKVTLETGGFVPKGGQTFNTTPFVIAKYPVTNAQFAKFVNTDGYEEKRWWTDIGWQIREEKKWTEPLYWKNKQWNSADYPVVGISWYESLAFCRWLSEMSGENILLPTEQQWQRAAQGNDNRVYPWGNEWDCKRCNSDISPCRSNSTTLVTQYEGPDKGDSPFNVVDMAGNALEWTLTSYENGSISLDGIDSRTLHSDSWTGFDSDELRNTFRQKFSPKFRYFTIGFRLARSYNSDP